MRLSWSLISVPVLVTISGCSGDHQQTPVPPPGDTRAVIPRVNGRAVEDPVLPRNRDKNGRPSPSLGPDSTGGTGVRPVRTLVRIPIPQKTTPVNANQGIVSSGSSRRTRVVAKALTDADSLSDGAPDVSSIARLPNTAVAPPSEDLPDSPDAAVATPVTHPVPIATPAVAGGEGEQPSPSQTGDGQPAIDPPADAKGPPSPPSPVIPPVADPSAGPGAPTAPSTAFTEDGASPPAPAAPVVAPVVAPSTRPPHVERRSPPPITPVAGARGMANSRASCYFNSIWQALSHCGRFKAAVAAWADPMGRRDPYSRIVRDSKVLLGKLWSVADPGRISARALLAALRRVSPGQFTEGQQQDAQEALVTLIGRLGDALHYALPNTEPVDSLFRSQISETIMCGGVPNSAVPQLHDRSILDVSLPEGVGAQGVRLETLIAREFEDEIVPSFRCDNPRYVGVKRSLWVSTPEILVVSLKRHRFTPDGGAGKIHTPVLAPNLLVLGPDRSAYTLVAIIHHAGQHLHEGHYVAQFLHDQLGNWYLANDDILHLVHAPVNASATAYIYLYEKVADT